MGKTKWGKAATIKYGKRETGREGTMQQQLAVILGFLGWRRLSLVLDILLCSLPI